MPLTEKFMQQLVLTSMLEWLAVLLAILYLLLAIKENPWCWVAAFFSTAIYVYLFFDINLFMESFLNAYYLLMAVYGWQQWHQGSKQKQLSDETNNQTIPINRNIIRWPLKHHLYAIVTCALLVIASYYLLSRYTQQAYPLLDSTTTWLAIFSTYLVTQKVLENWLYWIMIDLLSIYLYIEKGLALTALLFVGYVILSIYGWSLWKQHYQQTKKLDQSI